MEKRRPALPALMPLPTGGHVSSTAPSSESSGRSTTLNRRGVLSACEPCRNRKVKCGGERPVCHKCAQRDVSCTYATEPGENRIASVERLLEAAKQENTNLRELFDFLSNRPAADSNAVLQRLKAGADPIEILQFVRASDIRMQQRNPTGSGGVSDTVENIEHNAQVRTLIQVPARPWTVITGDDIVSEMVTSFFEHDHLFNFPFIDRELFIRDMRAGDLANARYCSPLLVNAMCALRCFTSNTVHAIYQRMGYNLRTIFFNEAVLCLGKERGKSSIPTVQALMIMFIYSAGIGEDRTGMVYRFTSCQMLHRMRLERLFLELRGPKAHEKGGQWRDLQSLSRMMWGFFCRESISAFAYLEPSLVPLPTVPKLFAPDYRTPGDTLPALHTESDMLMAMSALSQILLEIMSYNNQSENVGMEEDVETRIEFYRKVIAWNAELSKDLITENAFSQENYFLSTFEDMTVLGIFRPLHPDTVINLNGTRTVADICIHYCHKSIQGFEEYVNRWSLNEYSIMAIYPLYNVTMTLMSMLDNPRTHDPFTKACHFLLHNTQQFPFTKYLLQSLKPLAQRLHVELPPVMLSFDNLGLGPHELVDPPIAFLVPQHLEGLDDLMQDGEDDGYRVQLGTVISQYYAS